LDNKRPILFAGLSSSKKEGHAFVCDGYDIYDNFHINWGWDGYYNGYFAITKLNPDLYDFSAYQTIVSDIEPQEESNIDSDIKITLSPNPLKQNGTLSYYIVSPTRVEIKLIDIQGNLVKTLINEYKNEGPHDIVWDTSNLKAGVYFLQLISNKTKTIKIIVL
jgi:hypothetical protein